MLYKYYNAIAERGIELKNKVLSVIMAAAVGSGGFVLPQMPAAAETADVNVKLQPNVYSPFNETRFEGWGTALCWWANRIGYSEKLTDDAARLFYSEEGLSLDIGRYNIGGGDDPDHDHITRSDSTVPGYWKDGTVNIVNDGKDAEFEYDWTKDENQRNIAKKIQEYNSDVYFEGFSNSPPYFMTNSGCVGGGVDAADNLNPDMVDDFIDYIAEVTAHFKEDYGIEFKSYSPMNEPINGWAAYSDKQEGCNYNDFGLRNSVFTGLKERFLNYTNEDGEKILENVETAGMDETNLNYSIWSYDKLSDEGRNAIDRIDTHTYGGNLRSELRDKCIAWDKDLWMSEVDVGGAKLVSGSGNMGAPNSSGAAHNT